jgi:hypothetical protein
MEREDDEVLMESVIWLTDPGSFLLWFVAITLLLERAQRTPIMHRNAIGMLLCLFEI